MLSERFVVTQLVSPNVVFVGIFAAADNASRRDVLIFQHIYNPQIEMFARFKMKSSFHKTKRII